MRTPPEAMAAAAAGNVAALQQKLAAIASKKTSVQVYRDCLRTIKHMAANVRRERASLHRAQTGPVVLLCAHRASPRSLSL